ncbi:MAG TPA: 2-oxo-4-hydroxy-4-carboxy-5-ureidoimidazoline decarboxylase [Rhizomicrobium sp.]|jgi:2-oxo-4-hydroxy-4-carboxy-5-ureidoimidazoline decarboxylase|nr:2-oxo-4-hydroxy-4-carboxy-5-ureidoimidazoline decarboxylase [Rhizomicrobium sp.]
MAEHLKAPASAMTQEQFIAAFCGVYEHSPHFAAEVWATVPHATLDTIDGLANAFKRAVDASGHDAQLGLIRAHPDLADRVRLSAESVSEQAGAGLDNCSPEELTEFRVLNDAYKAKFGFPFIKAVRGFSRRQILAEFRARSGNDADAEFATALREIHKIAFLRLGDLA